MGAEVEGEAEIEAEVEAEVEDVIQESLHSLRKMVSRAAGELFIIICGCGLSLGRHENKGSWGEPHESAFA